MGRKIKVKQGNMSIDIDAASSSIFTDILDALPGDTIRILEDTTEEIYTDAYNAWPVQKPVSTTRLTEEGKVRVSARNISKTDPNDYSLKERLQHRIKCKD